jgi:hypothetical protein
MYPKQDLPRLASVTDIDTLSAADACAYLIGYDVNHIPHAAVARHRLVKIAIGLRTP